MLACNANDTRQSCTMRLIAHIKSLGGAASCNPETKKQKPKTLPRRQPINNLTHERFVILTPERGSIAMRRSIKRNLNSPIEDQKPLLLPVNNSFDFDFGSDEEKPATRSSSCNVSLSLDANNNDKENHQESSLSRSLSIRNSSLKRKRPELEGLVKRVKSVQVTPSRRQLHEWFDDTELDLKRYAIRAPALEAMPLQDSLAVETAAEAMARHAAVLDHRRASLGFVVY